MDNGVFTDANLLKVFIWCLLRANRSQDDKNVYNAKIKQGQFITGRSSASQELHMKPSTVHDRLKKLQTLGYIKIKSTTKYTIVSVLKFKQYQLDGNKPSKPIEERFSDFFEEVWVYVSEYDESVLNSFISYWTEKNKSKTKMRFELQPTWDTKRRLNTWNNNTKPKESKVQTQLDNWQKARQIINGQN